MATWELGAALDDYNSKPGYFNGVDSPPSGGDLAVILRFCVPGTPRDALHRLLREAKERPFVISPAEIEAQRQAVVDRHEHLKQLGRAPAPLEKMLAAFESVLSRKLSGTGKVFAERLAGELAEHLGMSAERGMQGYRSLQHNGPTKMIARHVDSGRRT